MEKSQKEINSKRDIVKEKFNELQDMAVSTIQNEIDKSMSENKISKASVRFRTTSNSLTGK